MAQSAVLTGASCLQQLDDVQPQELYVVPGTKIQSPISHLTHPEGLCELFVSATLFSSC